MEEMGQGTFRLWDVFGTPVLKPVNGFRLNKFYGHVLDVPKWMMDKAEDVGVWYIGVEMLQRNEEGVRRWNVGQEHCYNCQSC